ncbi:hypothetical protein KSD_43550 [Ktedonobacter sp. SOSP1-85]|uniref:AIPR family protein n=1 Tax=Ktedonobacter sp. SOSP1-85 TaxID=2778367 RepID=UPI00191560D7|nr:AIPR family protein [Ktedonobacter sp. SOSP1-85]GHO76584.1 hypothetical protein KSD_43550 [Ktedonobacter sp. SOSP1-85]
MNHAIQPSFDFHVDDLPIYLRSYDDLAQYFSGQLHGLNTTEKGSRFAHAVAKLVPQTDMGSEFDLPTLNSKKTRDEGIDLIAKRKDGRTLYIQSKLWINKSEDIDNIISKFHAFSQSTLQANNGQLLMNFDSLESSFMVVTLSPIQGLLTQYKKRAFSSKSFYNDLIQAKRLQIIDGHQILTILQASYSKINKVNTKIQLDFETDIIHKDNVYIGVLSSTSLRKLYDKMGDALFFENIRDFLGINNKEKANRKTPNKEIVKTIVNDADKMLSRNNGIVFSAAKVEMGASPKELTLHNSSVVNGCQTTMCIVEHAKQDCYVLAKIVEISESWDIATSANYQNSVADIDLELAQYLRPQLVKRAAAISGVQVDSPLKSPFQIIEDIYDRKVVYEETRLIYIGIFSKSPKNIFEVHYNHLMQDLLQKFYKDDKYGSKIFDIVFSLQTASQRGLKLAQETFKDESYANLFDRLYKEDSLSYRCFITILALCGLVNINIAKRESDPTLEYERMKKFFLEAQKMLDNNSEAFLRCYIYAVKVWMQEVSIDADPTEIQQNMFSRSKSLDFNKLYRNFCVERDMQERMDKFNATNIK